MAPINQTPMPKRIKRATQLFKMVFIAAIASLATLATTGRLEVIRAPPPPPWRATFGTPVNVSHDMWEKRLVLGQRQLQEGTVSLGNHARGRRFMQKLLDGKPISLGWVGGSIAAGRCTTDPSIYSFGVRVFEWINQTFPHPGHTWKNGGVSGTSSSYMALCLRDHVQMDVDLVLVEYAVNDNEVIINNEYVPNMKSSWDSHVRRTYERVIRKLLQFPARPALLLLAAFEHNPMFGVTEKTPLVPFYASAEDIQVSALSFRPDASPAHIAGCAAVEVSQESTPGITIYFVSKGVMAQYYSLPWVSFRDATWRSMRQNISGYQRHQVMDFEEHHPSDRGHLVMADLVVGWLQTMGRELQRKPYGEADEAIVQESLMDPMLKCYLGGDMEREWIPGLFERSPVSLTAVLDPGLSPCALRQDNEVLMDGDYCLMQEKFNLMHLSSSVRGGSSDMFQCAAREIVTRAHGFEWIDEENEANFLHNFHKLGYVGTRPGAVLEFRADTTISMTSGDTVGLRISFLSSYEHMGKASVTCVRECSCAETTFDGLWEEPNSQLTGHHIEVTRAKECIVRVQILEERNPASDAHKVKVAGLAISDDDSGDSSGVEDFEQLDWTHT